MLLHTRGGLEERARVGGVCMGSRHAARPDAPSSPNWTGNDRGIIAALDWVEEGRNPLASVILAKLRVCARLLPIPCSLVGRVAARLRHQRSGRRVGRVPPSSCDAARPCVPRRVGSTLLPRRAKGLRSLVAAARGRWRWAKHRDVFHAPHDELHRVLACAPCTTTPRA
jgi:hypothetical protein